MSTVIEERATLIEHDRTCDMVFEGVKPEPTYTMPIKVKNTQELIKRAALEREREFDMINARIKDVLNES